MEKIYKEEIQRLMPIFQAMVDGKTIQFAVDDNDWIDIDGDEEGLTLETLIGSPSFYRIKPEPKFRPFANAEECWAEMEKHQPFGWVKNKDTQSFFLCKAVGNFTSVGIENNPYTYDEVFKFYTFADGTPLA